MPEWLDRNGSVESGYKALNGQQHYFLVVKGPAFGVALLVVSFEAVEKIGEGITNDNGETSMAQSEIAELVRVELLGRAGV